MRSHTLTVNAHPFPSVYCFFFPLSLSVLVLVFLRGGNSSILNYVFLLLPTTTTTMDDTEEMRLTGGTLLHPHARTVMIVIFVVRVLVAGTSALTLGVQFHQIAFLCVGGNLNHGPSGQTLF